MTSKKLLLSLGLLTAATACKSASGRKTAKAESPNSPIIDNTNDDTPAGNGTDTNNSKGTATQSVKLAYPQPDPAVGEELQDGEIESAEQIATIIEKQIQAQYAGKRALRDAHPKSHGCVKADFAVEANIPAEFAQGVFQKGSSYKAVIRFSNSSENPNAPDIDKDGRGMAIKLMNVPGKKLLEADADAGTQDFIMISHPVFFIKDVKEYVTFIDKFQNTDLASKLATAKSLGVKGVQIAGAIKSLQVASPIQTTYHSNVPYQLGVGSNKMAVKYKAVPCQINGKDPIPEGSVDANYLRTSLVEHFKKSDGCMEIHVQKRGANDSVEDPREEWKGAFTKIATLTMKKEDQDIAPSNDPVLAQNIACDSLSYNPWHSIPEHKPLGSINRVRKIVYEHISKIRHEMNKEERREP